MRRVQSNSLMDNSHPPLLTRRPSTELRRKRRYVVRAERWGPQRRYTLMKGAPRLAVPRSGKSGSAAGAGVPHRRGCNDTTLAMPAKVVRRAAHATDAVVDL